MRRRHGVEVAWANEALRDPDALHIDPDPSSRSGERSHHRLLPKAGVLLTIITVSEGGTTYGVNGWRSNTTDIKRYGEESP